MSEDSLLSYSVEGLLDGVAARTPAPGGGSVTALTAAAAAGLVAMAARFSGESPDRADELRARLAQLADEDVAAYNAVLAAPRGQRAEALREATEVPRRIAEAAREVSGLAARLAEHGNPNLTGDARVGELLAEAAAKAATVLVEINTQEARHE